MLKNQVPSSKSLCTVVPHIALTVRPCHPNRAQQSRPPRTDRADMAHDRASSQFPKWPFFTSCTVVCLLGTTVHSSQVVLAVTNSWNFAIKAL